MTQTSLTITDLTRMSGSRVCIAAVTDQGCTIRPEFEHGFITEEWLFDQNHALVVQPFARVKMNLLKHCPHPPHSEDWLVQPGFKAREGLLTEPERERLLQRIADPSAAAIFGAEIHHDQGFFIREGEGTRSLGTVQAAWLEDVSYRYYDDHWDYRISFADCSGTSYRLGVTDLAFRLYLDHLRVHQGQDCTQIGWRLERKLQKSRLYLRIGLARPTWAKHPHCCFLQINGVYSFPDYLEGKSLADYRAD